ncbi:MauE/DoxX family redox-associated membrane protein [Chitinophaga sp. GCM10012297]|uniref:Methylamine utilisation protein MauE domain-containing protein n=1 Tax=Chitinophaga chungangae TaxID=2821488 RepID=A0ABS3YKM2_9BACT|nr:MauE/DoxX family redox-associated membrane protein [Chitinophaga chungangae]MBO9154838.1 hypothetical protein [Chitinophaga chungangae]
MREKAIPIHTLPQRPMKLRKWTVEAIVAILLIVWLHTSVSKLMDFGGLQIQMRQSPVFYKNANLAAIVGPSLEILLSILLIIKRTRVVGLFGSFLLMVFFTWYVAYLMVTMPHLPCSCGGIVGWLNWSQHLALNIFLTIISLIGFFLQRKYLKMGKP